MANDARSIYTGALRNTHAMEQQGLRQMELQVSRLERYPEYVALLNRHIQTTREQLKRLERGLEAGGTSPSTIKEEEQAARAAESIIEPVTRRYIELTTRGDKADR